MCLSFFLPLLRWKIHHHRFLRSFLLQIFSLHKLSFIYLQFLFYSLKHRFRLFKLPFHQRPGKSVKYTKKNICEKSFRFCPREGKTKTFQIFFSTCFQFSTHVTLQLVIDYTDNRCENDIKDWKKSSSIEKKMRAFRDFLSLPEANLAEIKIFT